MFFFFFMWLYSHFNVIFCKDFNPFVPWLVWLSVLSTGLQTEKSLVRFLVRAHAWVAGWSPLGGGVREVTD